jgi:hypothetical protein
MSCRRCRVVCPLVVMLVPRGVCECCTRCCVLLMSGVNVERRMALCVLRKRSVPARRAMRGSVCALTRRSPVPVPARPLRQPHGPRDVDGLLPVLARHVLWDTWAHRCGWGCVVVDTRIVVTARRRRRRQPRAARATRGTSAHWGPRLLTRLTRRGMGAACARPARTARRVRPSRCCARSAASPRRRASAPSATARRARVGMCAPS